MQRRKFILQGASLVIAGISLHACTTSATGELTSSHAESDKHRHGAIDADVDATLKNVESQVPGSRELISKARGVLVFPSVLAAGLGVGGQYGQGALRVNNQTVGYYNLASLSVGLQIGAQSKSVVFLMMTQDALDKFRHSEGWAVGGDASVAVAKIGANGMLEADEGPVVAFVMTNAGLMANLTFEGTKISRLES
jgi:lipid-binding SYLF domain-containing protein